MAAAHAFVAYISASANRHSQAADASSSSLIAFGSSKLISIWDTADEHDRGVLETLPGHEGLLTGIRFIREEVLVSADDKGSLRCWRKIKAQWKSTARVQAHTAAIASLGVHEQCVVTGSSDGSVKIWGFIEAENAGTTDGDETCTETQSFLDQLKETQVISMKGNYPLSLALASLPQTKAIILAIAGTDRNVQIWTRSEDMFVNSVVLSGHEDWVRSLAFRPPVSPGDPLVLASGSQDATIRLWNVGAFIKDERRFNDDLLDAFEANLGDSADASCGGMQISLKRHILTVKSDGSSLQFSVTFDALLVGHDAGITSLSWRPAIASEQSSSLLSTSTDSSLIIWSPSAMLMPSQEGSFSLWVNRQRFGDIGGQRLGGFIGGLWARDGAEALAWGWGGGWRRWRCDKNDGWTEVGAIGGHKGPVRSLDWSPKGEYIVSAGLDQTTRIHGEIPITRSITPLWHELSRPQVHGYDLLGVTFLDALRLVSIADEKVTRVFEAPVGFVNVIESLGVAKFTSDKYARPLAASVPPLGLSNKAICAADLNASSVPSGRRPFEGELASITLWPETEKIFGHGYESASLAVSKSRQFIATACKATTAEHAVVRVYDTANWQLVGKPLEGHSLTVTRIAFSPDDRFVLSVSRDRSWRLYERHDNSGYLPVAADKSHGRIIWDCAWAQEGDTFATASRDKTVKIWHPKDKADVSKWIAVTTMKHNAAATALAFAPVDLYDRRKLAVGLESGEILIYSNTQASSDWRLDFTLDSSIAHVDHIHQLAWRPTDQGQLASCSEDGTVKLFIIQMATDENDHPLR